MLNEAFLFKDHKKLWFLFYFIFFISTIWLFLIVSTKQNDKVQS